MSDDVTANRALAAKEVVDFVRVLVDGHKLGYRLAMLGDYHRLPIGLNLVQDREAMHFESTRRHFLHSAPRSSSSLSHGRISPD